MGEKVISRELFELFYNNRNKILNKHVNPFIMKGYTFLEFEELINCSISLGQTPGNIWTYISDNILNLKTPQWFYNKYKKQINWKFVTERIITYLDENDENMMNMFIVWLNDNKKNIQDRFLKHIATCQILPEVMIASFIDCSELPINSILGFQRLSTHLLKYVVESNRIDTNEWRNISLYQPMDPEFIEKYESKLDWNLIKYNQTWQNYPLESFHRLPVMDISNKFTWWTAKQKCDDLLLKKFYAMVDEKDNNYIILYVNNLYVLNNKTSSALYLFRKNINYSVDDISNISIKTQLNWFNNNSMKGKYLQQSHNKFWNIRDASINKHINHNLILYKDYHKIVYTLEPNIMDGSINSWMQQNTNIVYHNPMIVCDNTYNHSDRQLKIRIHYKDLMLTHKSTYNVNAFYIYLPLDCEITNVT